MENKKKWTTKTDNWGRVWIAAAWANQWVLLQQQCMCEAIVKSNIKISQQNELIITRSRMAGRERERTLTM